MNPLLRGAALGALLALSTGPVLAGVTVTYVHPEEFVDVAFAPVDRERILEQFTDYFKVLGAKLPAGQDLKVEVLDLDLAGRIVPSARFNQDIRVLHGGADWPRMHLRYTLTANGQVLRSGDEQVSDMSYMDRINTYDGGDPLRYEKRMLDDWFRHNFIDHKPG